MKWLSRIWLQREATTNWYHHHDNKRLPSMVSTETAALAWWPRTPPLFEMNVMAVITHPAHQEWITGQPDGELRGTWHSDAQGSSSRRVSQAEQVEMAEEHKFNVAGYAYAGGGRRVVLVEVSLDGGHSWTPSSSLRFIDGDSEQRVSSAHSRNERHWSWAHWQLEVRRDQLYHTQQIAVRAFDSAFNGQPEQRAWNFLGLQNNAYYRVHVEYSNPSSIRFVHPVQAGQQPNNGWMRGYVQQTQQQRLEGYATESSMGLRLVSEQEVAKHCTRDDCWVVIDGRVYDFTSFLSDHPGGDWSIACWAGRNAGAVFHDVHHDDVSKLKEMFCIGVMEPPKPPKQLSEDRDSDSVIQVFRWVTARLKRRRGGFVVRSYGPIRPLADSDESDDGSMDILFKVYYPVPAKHRPGGVLSCHLDSLHEGDVVKMKGPVGSLIYEGRGMMAFKGRSFHVDSINLLCGGTGITPAYALAMSVLRDGEDRTKIALIYSCVTPEEVMLRDELDEMAKRYKERFHLFYSVDRVESAEGHDQDEDKGKGEQLYSEQTSGKDQDAEEKNNQDTAVVRSNNHQQHSARHNGVRAHPPYQAGDSSANGGPARSKWCYHVGRIDEQLIRQHLFPPAEECVCFVCGPPPMLELTIYPLLDQYGFDLDKQVLEF